MKYLVMFFVCFSLDFLVTKLKDTADSSRETSPDITDAKVSKQIVLRYSGETCSQIIPCFMI